MDKYSQQSKRKNELLERYVNEVWKPLLPNATRGNLFSKIDSSLSKATNFEFKYANVELGSFNEILKDSDYYHTGRQFVHFTSLPYCINILREKAIRLYDFSNLNDPQEALFTGKYLLDAGDTNEINNPIDRQQKERELKQKLFCLSMCKFDKRIVDERLDMWRMYGRDGQGVAIVFSIDDNNRSEWMNYYLSKIKYGDENKKRIIELKDRHEKFIKENEFKVYSADKLAMPIIGFHKSDLYDREDEVRLLFSNTIEPESEDWPSEIHLDIGAKNQMVNYYALELNCEKNLYLKPNPDPNIFNDEWPLPKIEIESIILGYQYTDNNLREIRQVLQNLASIHLGYKVEIRLSDLYQYFNKN